MLSPRFQCPLSLLEIQTRKPMRGLTAVFGCVTAVFAQAGVIPPSSPVGGTSQQTLARQYAEWTASLPVESTDIFVNTRNQSPVVFLPSTSAPAANYALTVDVLTPLFFPIVYANPTLDNDQSTDGPPCDTAPDRFACWQADLGAFMDNPTELILRIDGVSFPISDGYRWTSEGAASILAPPSAFPNMLFDGWFVALDPLTPGQHVIEYGFKYGQDGVLQTTAITAVPLPSGLALILFGFTALRRHKSARSGPNPAAQNAPFSGDFSKI